MTASLFVAKIVLGLFGVSLVIGWVFVRFMSGAYQADDQALVIVQRDKHERSVTQVARGQLTAELNDPDYRLVSEMAMLSAVVYSGEGAPNHLPDYADQADLETYALERQLLRDSSWRPIGVPANIMLGLQPAADRKKLDGFTFDVWMKRAPGHAPLAVLVFRGTDEFADWKANLRPPTISPGRWDQYEQAEAVTKKMIGELDRKYGPGLRVFATGHSLGGGLAQCALNHSPRIDKVFAFNSSPLTGYHGAPGVVRRAKRRTYLIYESNEILAAARFVPLFVNRYTGRKDVIAVRYNFNKKSRGQHSMQPLVLGLIGGDQRVALALAEQAAKAALITN
ncbi:hypothetical protein GCM10027348_41650 [Hymenobacter tenuis]